MEMKESRFGLGEGGRGTKAAFELVREGKLWSVEALDQEPVLLLVAVLATVMLLRAAEGRRAVAAPVGVSEPERKCWDPEELWSVVM